MNEKKEKRELLQDIIRKLHAGADIKEVKKDFHHLIKNVDSSEIAELEQSLISEGFPPEEIQKLCDVHVEVFKDSLKKHKNEHKLPGHPIHTFIMENKKAVKISKMCLTLIKKTLKKGGQYQSTFLENYNLLRQIIVHYERKENQLFPYLEKKGFTGPAKVMWGKHDEVRTLFKEADEAIKIMDWGKVKVIIFDLVNKIKNMIFMEERILFPNAVKRLDERDWIEIRQGESDIGYAWVTPGNVWDANLQSIHIVQKDKENNVKNQEPSTIPLEEGNLSMEQINLLLKNLPLDISVVDENDKVIYYSSTNDRIFPRSPGVIGREVQNCHPSKSVHVVEQIISSFKKRKKKVAEFYITLNNRFIHIRYFPLYNESGEYKGVIEVSQDVTDIRNLEGEKRLLDWKE